MAEFRQRSSPGMRRAARLHADQAGRQLGEERQNLRSPQCLAHNNVSRRADGVKSKNALGQIKATNWARDMQISFAVQRLAEQDFRPTRNVKSRGGENGIGMLDRPRHAHERIGYLSVRGCDRENLAKVRRSAWCFEVETPCPKKTSRAHLDRWRHRQREELISTLTASAGRRHSRPNWVGTRTPTADGTRTTSPPCTPSAIRV